MFYKQLNSHNCTAVAINKKTGSKNLRLVLIFVLSLLLCIIYNGNIYAQNVTTATNGLSKPDASSVGLGGTLTQDTDIDLGATFNLGFKKGSSRYFNLVNNGNIGLGTSNPQAQFHTTGSLRFDLFHNNAAKDSLITTDQNGNLVFKSIASYVNASNGVSFDGSGLKLGGILTEEYTTIDGLDSKNFQFLALNEFTVQTGYFSLASNYGANIYGGELNLYGGGGGTLSLSQNGVSAHGGENGNVAFNSGLNKRITLAAQVDYGYGMTPANYELSMDTAGMRLYDFTVTGGEVEIFKFARDGRFYLRGYPLVDDAATSKALYVDAETGQVRYGNIQGAGGSLTAENGLEQIENSIGLGGSLNRNTQISILDNNFRLHSAGAEDSVFMSVGLDPENGRQFSAIYQGKDYNNEYDIVNKLTLGKFLALTFEGAPNFTNFYVGGNGLEMATYTDNGFGARNALALDSSGGGFLNERGLTSTSWVLAGRRSYPTLRDYVDLYAETDGKGSRMELDSSGIFFTAHIDGSVDNPLLFKIRNNGRLLLGNYKNNISGDSILTTDAVGNLVFRSLTESIPSLTFTNGLIRSGDSVTIGGRGENIELSSKSFMLDVYDPENQNGNSNLQMGPGYSILSAFRDWEPSNTQTSFEAQSHFGEMSWWDKRNNYKNALILGGGLTYGKMEDLGDGYVFSRQYLDITNDGAITLGDYQNSNLLLNPTNSILRSKNFIRLDTYNEDGGNLLGNSTIMINPHDIDLSIMNEDNFSLTSFKFSRYGLMFGKQMSTEGGFVFTDTYFSINNEGKLSLNGYLNNEAEDSVLTTDMFGNLKFKAINFASGGGADSAWAYDSVNIYNRNEGNVGIGTLTPTAKFHTLGSVRFESFKNNLQGDSVLTTDTEGNLRFVYMPYGSGGGGGEGYTFHNGLLQANGNVALGGQLEDSVQIDLAGYPFRLNNGAQKIWNISPEGNVGIGTSATDYRLTVKGDLSVGNAFDSVGAGERLWFNGYGNLDGLWISRFNLSPDASELRVNISDDGASNDKFQIGHFMWDNPTVWKSNFIVQANGQVGINTSVVNSDLTVGNGHGNKLTIGNSEWGKVNILSTGWDSNNNDYTDLLVPGAENNNAILRLNKAGNVGIGTLTPDAQYRLSVNGKIRAKGLRVQSSGWADFVFDPGYKLMQLPELEKFIRNKKHLPGIPTAADVQREGNDVGETQVQLLQKIEELTLYIIELNKQVKVLEEKNKTLENQQSKLAQMQQQIEELRKMILNK